MSYIICDIDGVLALRGERAPMAFGLCGVDTLNVNMGALLSCLHSDNVGVHLLTARSEQYRIVTESWLVANEVKYDKLWMRPLGDESDGAECKQTVYVNEILPELKVDAWAIFDDDERACGIFMNMNVQALQVYKDMGFREILPYIPTRASRSKSHYGRKRR